MRENGATGGSAASGGGERETSFEATRVMSVAPDVDADETDSGAAAKPLRGRGTAIFSSRAVGLEVLNGPRQNHVHSLLKGQIFILGRAPGLDVTILDQAVSRRHCQVTWVRDMLWIEDLASSNGTLVNGDAVERAALQDGDVIRIGETELLVSVLPEDHPALSEAGGLGGADPTMQLTRDDLSYEVERTLGSVRSALRDIERALIHAFRSANEAEGLYRAWVRHVKEVEQHADHAVAARERVEQELELTRSQVQSMGKMLSGDSVALNEEIKRLQDELTEQSDSLDESQEHVRELEEEISSLYAEVENQRTAAAIAKAALVDERKHAAESSRLREQE